MLKRFSISLVFVLGLVVFFATGPANGQLGNAGSIEGVVKDSSGGVVPGAKVEISYTHGHTDRAETRHGGNQHHGGGERRGPAGEGPQFPYGC